MYLAHQGQYINGVSGQAIKPLHSTFVLSYNADDMLVTLQFREAAVSEVQALIHDGFLQ